MLSRQDARGRGYEDRLAKGHCVPARPPDAGCVDTVDQVIFPPNLVRGESVEDTAYNLEVDIGVFRAFVVKGNGGEGL